MEFSEFFSWWHDIVQSIWEKARGKKTGKKIELTWHELKNDASDNWIQIQLLDKLISELYISNTLREGCLWRAATGEREWTQEDMLSLALDIYYLVLFFSVVFIVIYLCLLSSCRKVWLSKPEIRQTSVTIILCMSKLFREKKRLLLW